MSCICIKPCMVYEIAQLACFQATQSGYYPTKRDIESNKC